MRFEQPPFAPSRGVTDGERLVAFYKLELIPANVGYHVRCTCDFLMEFGDLPGRAGSELWRGQRHLCLTWRRRNWVRWRHSLRSQTLPYDFGRVLTSLIVAVFLRKLERSSCTELSGRIFRSMRRSLWARGASGADRKGDCSPMGCVRLY
uniref:Uncharacterized protein n=1 Tax=Trypanosoma congolense (strain IL3000) TaxID=1068625 RepID=G0UM85_TRYCI|nr:hypothetical protein, unlikely [Trypanosoma congolense IL3000]